MSRTQNSWQVAWGAKRYTFRLPCFVSVVMRMSSYRSTEFIQLARLFCFASFPEVTIFRTRCHIQISLLLRAMEPSATQNMDPKRRTLGPVRVNRRCQYHVSL